MLPWLDFALAGMMLWETVSGYVYGVKVALIRICVLVGALLVSVPLAPNCAAYLGPVLGPTIKASIAARAAEVSTGSGTYVYFGPWHSILGISAAWGVSAYFDSLLKLTLNIYGLSFLLFVLLCAYRLTERKQSREPQIFGAAAGLAGGILTAAVILALTPVLAWGRQGQYFASAIEASWIAHLFGRAVQSIVSYLAFYLY